MTKRITISVPDDVAAHLETVGEGKVSSYVTEAVRRTARRAQQEQALEELYALVGRPSEEDIAKAVAFGEEVLRWRAGRLGQPGRTE